MSDRDPKPHIVAHYPGSSGQVIDALYSLCDEASGAVRALPRRDWLGRADLERGAWLRGVDSLRSMGLVVAKPERCGRVAELRYTLTPAGLANAAHRLASANHRAGGEPVSEPVRAGQRATLGSGLSALYSKEKGTEKKEETPCSCHHDRAGGEPVASNTEPVSGPVSKLEALLALVAPGLVEAVEGYLRAATAELLREANAPALAASAPQKCGCGEALEEATRKRDKVKFMRCPDWRTCSHWKARGKGKESDAGAPNLARPTADFKRSVSDAKAQKAREDAEQLPTALNDDALERIKRATAKASRGASHATCTHLPREGTLALQQGASATGRTDVVGVRPPGMGPSRAPG